jgi:hypothetical protein
VSVPAPLNGTDCVKFDTDGVLGRLLRFALSVNTMAPVIVPDGGAVYDTEKMHAPAGGRVAGNEDAPLVQATRAMLNGAPEGVAAEIVRLACPRLETVNGWVPVWFPKSRLP